MGEPWQWVVGIAWTVLLGASVPVTLLSLVQSHRGKSGKDVWVKYGVWFVIVPLITVPMVLGGPAVQALLLVLSLMAYREFMLIAGLREAPRFAWAGAALIAAVHLAVFLGLRAVFLAMPAVATLVIVLVPVLSSSYDGAIQRCSLTLFGVIYFGWLFAHLSLLLNLPEGRALVGVFLILVVLNDASAYLLGSAWGRTPLSPALSARKTVEGALGGLAVTVAAGMALWSALAVDTRWTAALLASAIAVAGLCGDLTMSFIKRDLGIKDTGTLIPGHGGLLDRIDSSLFAAPVYVYVLQAVSPVEIISRG